MGVKTYVLATEEDIGCEDKEWSFRLPRAIYDNMESATLHLDIDPAWPIPGCPASKIVGVLVNGEKVWEGASVDKVDVDVTDKLIPGKNVVYVEFYVWAGLCAMMAVGRISGRVEVEGEFPSEVVTPTPPEEVEEECKVLGILPVGKMSKETCQVLNTAGYLTIGLIGLALVISLVKS